MKCFLFLGGGEECTMMVIGEQGEKESRAGGEWRYVVGEREGMRERKRETEGRKENLYLSVMYPFICTCVFNVFHLCCSPYS